MIFLPNIFERYTAALRNFIHFSALKNGKNQHHMSLLKRIYEAEAIYNSQETAPIDIYRYSISVLDAAKIISDNHKSFEYAVETAGCFLINKRLFTVLLLLLFSKKITFNASVFRERLIIKTDTAVPKDCKRVIYAMNGLILKSAESRGNIIMLRSEKTTKKAQFTESELELLSDPFSPVHIFLEGV